MDNLASYSATGKARTNEVVGLMFRLLRIRSALLTLVGVFILVMLIAEALKHYLHLIIIGIVVITLVNMIINRDKRI
jgi:hypothetical protein